MKKFLQLLALASALVTSTVVGGMTLPDVQRVIAQAVQRANAISPNSVIAVVDREGFVLGVLSVNGDEPTDGQIAAAVSKAGTAAFLSSNQEALTSRSAGFIVQQHFPPGVDNKPPGPLVGVNFSNLEFSDINKFKAPGSIIDFSSSPGNSIVPVPGSSLGGSPGGLPLYKNGRLIGGIGVTGDGSENIQVKQRYDVDEDVARAGQIGFQPKEMFAGSHVFIDGIRVAYVNSSTRGSVTTTLTNGTAAAAYPPTNSPTPFAYPMLKLGGVNGQLRQPIIDDPLGKFSKRDITNILAKAAHRAGITRAGIRLPVGQAAQVWITVVNNPPDGSPPQVLGTFRTADATIFSWDVAVQKARTALYFSKRKLLPGQTTPIAFSTRAVGFLAQSFYPPGIVANPPGPFLGLQEIFSGFAGSNTLNGVVIDSASPLKPELPNGITIFPGGFPLYKNGELIGAIGVSGDGIDQDDIIAASGTVDFLAPLSIRSDRFFFRGARLPYAKFPRNPSL